MKYKIILVFIVCLVGIINFASAAISLNSPGDGSTAYSKTVTFNANASTDSSYFVNFSLYHNGDGTWTLRNTTSTKSDILDYDNMGDASINTSLWGVTQTGGGSASEGSNKISLSAGGAGVGVGKVEAYALPQGISNLTFTTNTTASANVGLVWYERITLFGTQIYNVNFYQTQIFNDKFTVNGTGDTYSIYRNGAYQQTITATDNNLSVTCESVGGGGGTGTVYLQYVNYTYYETTPNKTFISTINQDSVWNFEACLGNGTCYFAPSNFTLYLDIQAPSISTVQPSADYLSLGQNLSINFTATDTNLDTCWYEYASSNTTVSCSSGTPVLFNLTIGSQKNVTIYANDTIGNLNSSLILFNNKILQNSQTYNNQTYETSRETFTTNLTYDSGSWSAIAAKLYYDSTGYTATKIGTGDTVLFNVSANIPTITTEGNKNFLWNIKLTNATGDYYYNSTSYQQMVNFTHFVLCNATYTVPYINFTFKDEDLNSMTAAISTSTFDYYLGDGTYKKQYTFSNNTEHLSYAFCFSPPDKTVNIDYTISYKNDSHPQRIYNPSVSSFSNSTVNQVLYLLSENDGQYVTFQVLNTADQTVSGVTASANRSLGGVTTNVGTGTTDDAGAVTFWLNPDFSHDFVFTKTGYETYTTSITPTQTSYTIVMGEQTTIVGDDYTRGIEFAVLPKTKQLNNDTSYEFEFNVSSSYWDVSSFGFNLRLSNGTIPGSDSSAVLESPASFTYNVNNQSIIYMDYYWIIDGNRTEGTTYWIITNTGNTQWSIKTFFTHFNTYIDEGLFGMTDFTRLVIVFIILIGTIGLMSYKYGLSNPMLVTGAIFLVVYFFDYIVGLVPQINGIDHVLTYLAGILFFGVIIREGARG